MYSISNSALLSCMVLFVFSGIRPLRCVDMGAGMERGNGCFNSAIHSILGAYLLASCALDQSDSLELQRMGKSSFGKDRRSQRGGAELDG